MDLWTIIHILRNTTLNDPRCVSDPKPILAAKTFRHILMNLPIGLNDGETIVGDIDVKFLTDDARRSLELQRAEHDRRTQNTAAPATTDKQPRELLAEHFHCFGIYAPAHTCVNYERVITEGFVGILDQIAREKQAAHAANDTDKIVTLDAMAIALSAVADFAERYADLADQRANDESSAEKKRSLQTIADICRRVPMQPATTFRDALQAVWFVHLTIGISELCDASISLGRLDQYAFGLFQRDLDRGVPIAELETSLIDLHRKLNRYGDAACTSNLGGVDEHGRDLFNALSQLILNVAKKLLLPAPILAARIHKDLPKDIFDALIDPKLFAIGQPTFYGEFSCRNALRHQGVPADHLHRWAANSCMGLMMPGEEIANMWGGVIPMLLPMELALNNGQPFHHALPIACSVAPKSTFADFHELYTQLLAYTQTVVEFCVARCLADTRYYGTELPNPFLSALTDECIVRGRDRANGGARYHVATFDAFGLVNVADALFAIQKLVFEQKRFTLAELVNAAKTNFIDAAEIHQAILALPKYGNGDPAPDDIARTLADDFAKIISRHTTAEVIFAPSFHTLNTHVDAGAKYGASLDGRLAGTPIAKNVGTSPGNNRTGHTALMDSATAIDQSAFFGGQALDISFTPDALTSPRDRLAIQALLQTYFRLGGLQVQVNSIDPNMLRNAIDDPESHRHLIVRIAGYSARFTTLGRPIQYEMVDRFERGV